MEQFFNLAASYVFGALDAKAWNHNNIKWQQDLAIGKKKAIERQIPAMVVVHRTNCPTCMALKPRFKNNREIEKLSKEFVMINIEDEKEANLQELNADGDYVPRILFYDSSGHLMRQVKNSTSDYGKYFHIDSATIIRSMKHALTLSCQSNTTLQAPSRPQDVVKDPNAKVPSIPRPSKLAHGKITSTGGCEYFKD